MNYTFWIVLMVYVTKCVSGCCNGAKNELNTISSENVETRLENTGNVGVSTRSGHGSLTIYPTVASWSVQTSIPLPSSARDFDETDFDEDEARGKKRRGGMKKKMKKYMMPLLIAYKLKFFTIIPVMIGGLVLLTGATGLAGFFFALFAAVMALKNGHH